MRGGARCSRLRWILREPWKRGTGATREARVYCAEALPARWGLQPRSPRFGRGHPCPPKPIPTRRQPPLDTFIRGAESLPLGLGKPEELLTFFHFPKPRWRQAGHVLDVPAHTCKAAVRSARVPCLGFCAFGSSGSRGFLAAFSLTLFKNLLAASWALKEAVGGPRCRSRNDYSWSSRLTDRRHRGRSMQGSPGTAGQVSPAAPSPAGWARTVAPAGRR